MKAHASEANTARKSLGTAAPAINVTPLIDVLLVLLIIFMVIQPQREAKFEAQIPQKPVEEPIARPEPPADLLVVEVKAGIGIEQTVELNSKTMSLIELGFMLKEVLEQRSDKTVYVKAAKEKKYKEIIYVIDVVKGAGAGPIGLQIDYLA